MLVVSDRNVIDAQLQDALFGFQRKTGVVATIQGKGGSKSAELAQALSGDKKIVVCTIHAHTPMSSQTINSSKIKQDIKDILLDNSSLWETLRSLAASGKRRKNRRGTTVRHDLFSGRGANRVTLFFCYRCPPRAS